jgi:hypothetical protein
VEQENCSIFLFAHFGVCCERVLKGENDWVNKGVIALLLIVFRLRNCFVGVYWTNGNNLVQTEIELEGGGGCSNGQWWPVGHILLDIVLSGWLFKRSRSTDEYIDTGG